MDSTKLLHIERKIRLSYEWSRLRRALLGFAPVSVLVALAASLGTRPESTLFLGACLFVVGVVLLWQGRELRRAVLPGVGAGLVPLGLALVANQFGHVCMGSGCTSLCLPACVAGGLIAGFAVAGVGHRGNHGAGFWFGASSVALLTGAMGCACVGYSGIAGLALGFGAGLLPSLVRRAFDGQSA